MMRATSSTRHPGVISRSPNQTIIVIVEICNAAASRNHIDQKLVVCFPLRLSTGVVANVMAAAGRIDVIGCCVDKQTVRIPA